MLQKHGARICERRPCRRCKKIPSQSLGKRVGAIQPHEVGCRSNRVGDGDEYSIRSCEALLARNYPANDRNDDYNIEIPLEVDTLACGEQQIDDILDRHSAP